MKTVTTGRPRVILFHLASL